MKSLCITGPLECPSCARRDVIEALELRGGRVVMYVRTHSDCDGSEMPWSVGLVSHTFGRPMDANLYGRLMQVLADNGLLDEGGEDEDANTE